MTLGKLSLGAILLSGLALTLGAQTQEASGSNSANMGMNETQATAGAEENPVVQLEPIVVEALPGTLSSEEQAQAYLDSYEKTPGSLYPTEVTMPYFTGNWAGTTVELSLTIDAEGEPHDVGVMSGASDRGLALHIINAVREWQFSPRQVDGENVSTQAKLTYSVTGNS